jgi:hypothetical protein
MTEKERGTFTMKKAKGFVIIKTMTGNDTVKDLVTTKNSQHSW